MFDRELTPKEKLQAMVEIKSISELSRLMDMDRKNIRDLLKDLRTFGPVTIQKIEKAYATIWAKATGVPELRFAKPLDTWLGEFRAIDSVTDRSARMAAIRHLFYHDKLSAFRFETWTEKGPDQESTVRRASMNLVGAGINWRAATALTHANERLIRIAVAKLAVEQFKGAGLLFRAAKDFIGAKPVDGKDVWTLSELRVLMGYALFNSLAVLSWFRESRAEQNGGFFAFKDHEAKDALMPVLDDIADVLDVYTFGHPLRGEVAANTLTIGSIAHNLPLALKGWYALAEEDREAVDLRYKLPFRDRPLSESSDLKWLIELVGYILPTRQ